MYTGFYRLTGRPFQLSPNRRFFFASRAHRQALARLADGLAEAEGALVVTGATGSGKTLLIDFLTAQLPAARFLIVRLDPPRADQGDVLAELAGVLGLDGNDHALGIGPERLSRIRAHLTALRAGRRLLVVVDEGQSWSPAALEQLRLVLDLHANGRALAQVLLVGQPGLDQRLAAPELLGLCQRVVVHHRLGPLAADEIGPYIEHRLRRVGWRDDPRFTADALPVIFAYTEGLPRLVNRLCSRLLVLGAVEDWHRIDAAAVADAIAATELEHLPPPEVEPPAAGTAEAPWPAEGAPPSPETRSPEPSGPAPEAPAGVSGQASEMAAIDQWWAEVAHLQRQLERALGDLSGERSRTEAMRAEADRLRAELHRIELDRLRLDAETSRRAVEALARATHPEDARLFRRFADEEA